MDIATNKGFQSSINENAYYRSIAHLGFLSNFRSIFLSGGKRESQSNSRAKSKSAITGIITSHSIGICTKSVNHFITLPGGFGFQNFFLLVIFLRGYLTGSQAPLQYLQRSFPLITLSGYRPWSYKDPEKKHYPNAPPYKVHSPEVIAIVEHNP